MRPLHRSYAGCAHWAAAPSHPTRVCSLRRPGFHPRAARRSTDVHAIVNGGVGGGQAHSADEPARLSRRSWSRSKPQCAGRNGPGSLTAYRCCWYVLLASEGPGTVVAMVTTDASENARRQTTDGIGFGRAFGVGVLGNVVTFIESTPSLSERAHALSTRDQSFHGKAS